MVAKNRDQMSKKKNSNLPRTRPRRCQEERHNRFFTCQSMLPLSTQQTPCRSLPPVESHLTSSSCCPRIFFCAQGCGSQESNSISPPCPRFPHHIPPCTPWSVSELHGLLRHELDAKKHIVTLERGEHAEPRVHPSDVKMEGSRGIGRLGVYIIDSSEATGVLRLARTPPSFLSSKSSKNGGKQRIQARGCVPFGENEGGR